MHEVSGSGSAVPLPTDVRIKKLSEVDETTAREAIERINASNDWEKNTRFVLGKYFKEDSILFAVKDDKIIGYVTHREYSEGKSKPERAPHVYIPYIAVDQEQKSQGIGTEMMMKVLSIAKGPKDASKLVLDCRANPGVLKFYQRIGGVAKERGIITPKDVKRKDMGQYSNGDRKMKFTYYLKEQ